MSKLEQTAFCIHCRKKMKYSLKTENISQTIRGKAYTFNITTAKCAECGEDVTPLGLIDQQTGEIDAQYRATEGIVTINGINNLMNIYDIGKAPLSLALGFGEITITRYLEGQVPSAEYSAIIKNALSSPSYMKNCLTQNRDKITSAAYSKAMSVATQMEKIFNMSPKLIKTISRIFETLEEVTPLTLQKLLYFIQGIHLALYDEPIFPEDCEAWAHGPVYANVYNLFKDFKYNPIDDAKFAMFDVCAEHLTEDELNVIDLVLRIFGVYSGKELERITHNETPWKKAREGYADNAPSRDPITKDCMKAYYKHMNDKFGFSTDEGLDNYVQYMRRLL